MTVKSSGKSFLVVLSHAATKNCKAEEKTLRVKTWAGIESLIKKWNLDQI